MARRRPPSRPLATLVLAALLAGCSGTPLGDSLSRSFPGPGGGPPPDTADGAGGGGATGSRAPAGATTGDATTTAQPAQTDPAARPTEKKPAKPPAPPKATAPKPTPAAAAAVPYRLVLRLPLADPAAPAEVVTDALRAAGVSFEVETIERLPAGSEAGKAGANPAEAEGQGAAAGTESRPAPEPR